MSSLAEAFGADWTTFAVVAGIALGIVAVLALSIAATLDDLRQHEAAAMRRRASRARRTITTVRGV